jgi:hypothetical protein
MSCCWTKNSPCTSGSICDEPISLHLLSEEASHREKWYDIRTRGMSHFPLLRRRFFRMCVGSKPAGRGGALIYREAGRSPCGWEGFSSSGMVSCLFEIHDSRDRARRLERPNEWGDHIHWHAAVRYGTDRKKYISFVCMVPRASPSITRMKESIV